jgi:hypothetical protein
VDCELLIGFGAPLLGQVLRVADHGQEGVQLVGCGLPSERAGVSHADESRSDEGCAPDRAALVAWHLQRQLAYSA